MNITDMRRSKAHLFSPSALSLDVTDPEFSDIISRFAFTEVTQFGDLETRDKILISLACVIASNGKEAFHMVLKGALKAGIKEEEIKELIYQSTAYVGVSGILYYLRETNKELDRKGHDFSHEKRTTIKEEERREKGEEVQVKIFGPDMKGSSLKGDDESRHISRWISENCYGDYYTREGLSLKDRELITFTILLSSGCTENQLKRHLQGNLNLNRSRKELIEAASECIPFIGYPKVLKAIDAINELTLKSESAD